MNRLFTHAPPTLRMLHVLRSLAMLKSLTAFRRIRSMLRTDLRFRAFHEGRSVALPDCHCRVREHKLGKYAALLSPADRTPVLETP